MTVWCQHRLAVSTTEITTWLFLSTQHLLPHGDRFHPAQWRGRVVCVLRHHLRYPEETEPSVMEYLCQNTEQNQLQRLEVTQPQFTASQTYLKRSCKTHVQYMNKMYILWVYFWFIARSCASPHKCITITANVCVVYYCNLVFFGYRTNKSIKYIKPWIPDFFLTSLNNENNNCKYSYISEYLVGLHSVLYLIFQQQFMFSYKLSHQPPMAW